MFRCLLFASVSRWRISIETAGENYRGSTGTPRPSSENMSRMILFSVSRSESHFGNYYVSLWVLPNVSGFT